MKRTLSLAFLLLVAALHSQAYVYAWAFIGPKIYRAFFAAGDFSGRYLTQVIVGDFLAAIISTAPIAFITGLFLGSRYRWGILLSVVVGSVAFQLYVFYIEKPKIIIWTRVTEVVIIAIIAYLGLKAAEYGTRIKNGPSYHSNGTR